MNTFGGVQFLLDWYTCLHAIAVIGSKKIHKMRVFNSLIVAFYHKVTKCLSWTQIYSTMVKMLGNG